MEVLPCEVGERLVGVSHAMGLFSRVHGFAFAPCGVPEFAGEPLGHRLAGVGSCGLNDPSEAKRLLPPRVDLHGYLVVGSADSFGSHFDGWFYVVDRTFENLDRGFGNILAIFAVDSFLNEVECVVNDSFGDGFFAIEHDAIGEFCEYFIVVFGIGAELCFGFGDSAGHGFSFRLIRFALSSRWCCGRFANPFVHRVSLLRTRLLARLFMCEGFWSYLPLFAPYLDRACLRPSTPRQSSVPRTTWYRTPGRSRTRPPRTMTIECSWRLWPSPPM